MRRFWRIFLVVLGILLVVLLVGPFLVPVPPLEGTLPPEELADPDSRFVDVNGLRVHYKRAGQGRPAIVLLHGFGASTFSWREVMAPLAQYGTVIAFDRPASGLTSRPMPGEWSGESPYRPEAQADLTVALLDEFGFDRAILVGHSAGGTIAVLTALRHPERVQALVLAAPAIYEGGSPLPGWLSPVLGSPQLRRVGPLLVRSIQSWGEDVLRRSWHDPSQITSEILEGYRKALQAENWDRGLWELTVASHPLGLGEGLGHIRVPTLIITGDDDRIVPTENSVRAAGEIPGAELVLVPACGHLPQEEQPEAFLGAVEPFLRALEGSSAAGDLPGSDPPAGAGHARKSTQYVVRYARAKP